MLKFAPPNTQFTTDQDVVLVSGRFNVLHPGHIRLLRYAKSCGKRLVVAVESDRLAGEEAVVSQSYRLEGILANSWVDDAFIFDEPIDHLIRRLKPRVVVKGKEHESRVNAEAHALREYGGALLFSSGEIVFSSLDLLRREFKDVSQRSIILPHDFLVRHRIETSKLLDYIHQFKRLKVLVLGDLIVDEYITCQPLGMSQEDPTIVVAPIDKALFLGGAGIVAAHASGLGAEVDFLTVTGSDATQKFCHSILQDYGVHAEMLIDANRPTTLKQRFRSKGKTLLRVSHLLQDSISLELQELIYQRIEQLISSVDLLVFSDFNYGCLPQKLVDRIICLAQKHETLMVADSQSSSQIGDISRFKGMDIITPTEREARISLKKPESGLVVLAEELRTQSHAKGVLLKLGEEGVLIQVMENGGGQFITDRIAALNSQPKDVAGAGDSMLITAGLAKACGATIWEAAVLGSVAAAIQVSRIGNTPLTSAELCNELKP